MLNNYSSQIEHALGVKLDSSKKPNVGVKKLEEILEEVHGEYGATLIARIGDELDAAEYPETVEEEKQKSQYMIN